MTDEIVKAPDQMILSGLEIVDKIIEEMGDELPDKVIEATELLLSGFSTYQAARKVGTSAKTIRHGWRNIRPWLWPFAMAASS